MINDWPILVDERKKSIHKIRHIFEVRGEYDCRRESGPLGTDLQIGQCSLWPHNLRPTMCICRKPQSLFPTRSRRSSTTGRTGAVKSAPGFWYKVRRVIEEPAPLKESAARVTGYVALYRNQGMCSDDCRALFFVMFVALGGA